MTHSVIVIWAETTVICTKFTNENYWNENSCMSRCAPVPSIAKSIRISYTILLCLYCVRKGHLGFDFSQYEQTFHYKILLNKY